MDGDLISEGKTKHTNLESQFYFNIIGMKRLLKNNENSA
jgi:hypothetical protein